MRSLLTATTGCCDVKERNKFPCHVFGEAISVADCNVVIGRRRGPTLRKVKTVVVDLLNKLDKR